MTYTHLTIEERERIQEEIWHGQSIRSIAKRLQRSAGSISRELRRNCSPEKKLYRPRHAHERALKKRTSRGRKERLKSVSVRTYVHAQLKRRYSPEQIAGCIKNAIGETISHEAIYRYIYAQIKNGYPRKGCEDLRPYLRRRRKRRIPHGARRCQRILQPRGPSIDTRPRIVETRRRLGDWEGDTVESRDHKPGINTLVERKTGMVFITKLSSKKSDATTAVLRRRFEHVPLRYKQTLTLDNGSENAQWKTIEAATGMRCYFAHPYHSWERGTNENTNGLIRDYFPKKTDFSTISDEEVAFVEAELNNRPRKRLGWKTPLEVWSVALRS